MTTRKDASRLLKLLAVGGTAFVVDAGAFTIAIEVFGLIPIMARLVAFTSALTFSFLLNRAVTFADRPRRGVGQLAAYVAASVVAGAANIATFAGVLGALPSSAFAPYVAMPVGVMVGLLINYTLYNRVVFAPDS